MALYGATQLEKKKYKEIVKLSKQHNVYRRYGTKMELIENLMELKSDGSGNFSENTAISDISMPNCPELTDDDDDEEASRILVRKPSSRKTPKASGFKVNNSKSAQPVLFRERKFGVSDTDFNETKNLPNTASKAAASRKALEASVILTPLKGTNPKLVRQRKTVVSTDAEPDSDSSIPEATNTIPKSSDTNDLDEEAMSLPKSANKMSSRKTLNASVVLTPLKNTNPNVIRQRKYGVSTDADSSTSKSSDDDDQEVTVLLKNAGKSSFRRVPTASVVLTPLNFKKPKLVRQETFDVFSASEAEQNSEGSISQTSNTDLEDEELAASLPKSGKKTASKKTTRPSSSRSTANKSLSSNSARPKLVRQGTFDVSSEIDQCPISERSDVDSENENVSSFPKDSKVSSVKMANKFAKNMPSEATQNTIPFVKLLREGTFDISTEEPNQGASGLKREGTFDKDISVFARESLPTPDTGVRKPLTPVSNLKTPSMLRSAKKSPLVSITKRRIAEPKAKLSSGIRNGSTRFKRTARKSVDLKKAYELEKEKDPSMQEFKLKPTGKVPDFNSIHKKLADRMESLVDSRKKVLKRAEQYRAWQGKTGFGTASTSSDTGHRVARKLLSPETKLTSSEANKGNKPTAVESAKKTPSPRGRMSTGERKIDPQSPGAKVPNFLSKIPLPIASTSTLNTTKANDTEPRRKSLRKEELKQIVSQKLPIREKNASTARSRGLLHTVRLNKRFELQMQYRMKNSSSTTNV